MSDYLDIEDPAKIWPDGITENFSVAAPCYVAISGNTGVGKSYMVKKLLQQLAPHFKDRIVAINERQFHHPLLRRMFFDPERYAFGVQLNFLLQRYLCLKNLFDHGSIVIVERSHLDDRLFLDEHFAIGNIDDAQRDMYYKLSSYVETQLKMPDMWILLETSPDISKQRIDNAEMIGERPREFPSEEAKKHFIFNWHQRYQKFFDDITNARKVDSNYKNTNTFRIDSSECSDDNYIAIAAKIVRLAALLDKHHNTQLE